MFQINISNDRMADEGETQKSHFSDCTYGSLKLKGCF